MTSLHHSHLWPLPLVPVPIPLEGDSKSYQSYIAREFQLQERQSKAALSTLHGERVQLGSLASSLHALFFIFETWNNNYPLNQLKASHNEIREILNGKHAEFWERRSIHTGAWLVWIKVMEDRLLHMHSCCSFDYATQWWRIYANDHTQMIALLKCMSRNRDSITKREWNRMRIIFRGGSSLTEESSHLVDLLPKDFWYHDQVSIHQLAKFICDHLQWNDTLFPRVEHHSSSQSSRSTASHAPHSPSQSATTWLKTSPRSQFLSICNVTNACCKYQASAVRPFVRIFNCTSTVLYILHPLECLHIDNLSNCTIVLGAIRKVVSIENCTNCKFILATRCLQVMRSTHILINCCVNIPPLITDSCVGVQIAPHNTYYSELPAHLQSAGVNPKLNQFRDPFVMHTFGEQPPLVHTPSQNADSTYCCRLLPPSEFTQFAIPFEEDSTHQPPESSKQDKVNVCAIPSEYASALRDKMWTVAKLFDQMKKAIKTNPTLHTQLEHHIGTEFQQWLQKDRLRWQECASVKSYDVIE